MMVRNIGERGMGMGVKLEGNDKRGEFFGFWDFWDFWDVLGFLGCFGIFLF